MRNSRRIVLCSLVIAAAASFGCGHRGASNKLIVLGVDGMDPGFVERHWSDLPNLRRLRAMGSFHRLGTTTPPQSPVAWSTFITGLEPAEHGIFDFVHRDAKTLQPFSSMAKTEPAKWNVSLGPYRVPLSSPRISSLRRGEAFWKILAGRGVPVTMIRMPTNYPPVDAGQAIAGMGAPDLEGTQGTFSFFTTNPEELDREVAGGHIRKIGLVNGHADVRLTGPPNSLRRDEQPATAVIAVDVDPDRPLVRIVAGSDIVVLREGEWSGWIPVEFELMPHLASTRGMVRAFVKRVHPSLDLYFTPVNADPRAPALPVSQPKSFTADVAARVGRFFTLGIPEDTAALRQGVFNLPQFLSQTRLVAEDEHTLLRDALLRYTDGLLFVYFSSIDENSHILWGKHDGELLKVYREIDRAIGETMRQRPDADLIVMSDHGFTNFDRAVNLNTWLAERGFLSLKSDPGPAEDLSDADWPGTEAYALGLNAVYLNLAGREKNGLVQRGQQRDTIAQNLREQLLAFRDPANGRQVVESVEIVKPSRENAEIAPDLIVGYAPGYRASWQTGLGGVPTAVVEDNNDAWIGDHCISAASVPGVLFTKRLANNPTPRLQDVTASVLDTFGAPHPPGMRARSVY